MSVKCRVLKDFPWMPSRCKYIAGQTITPAAQIRKLWLRRGLIEVIGEEAVERKEAAATPAPRKRRRKAAA